MLKRLALTLLLIAPSLAGADDSFFFDDQITKEYLEGLEVNVSIQDDATGACWTNLKEVREYAEEKLRTLGVQVSETNYMVAEVNIYWFIIKVNARRLYKDGSGPCHGNYSISLDGWATINDVTHLALLGAREVKPFIPTTENFNRPILIGLEKAFSDFPR
jgi:hypothetical protein